MKRMIIFLISTIFHICLSLNTTTGDRRVFKIALLIPWNVSYDFSGYTSSSAVSLAIKELERESFFKDDISFTFLARDDNCRSKEALGNAADLLINETIDVFIGPPCSAAELASVFEVPIISWVATDPDFDDKITYSTLARTLGPFSKMGTFLLEIFHYYSWKRVVIISSTYLLYHDAANAIKKVFNRENMTISYQAQYDQPLTDSYIRATLTKTKEEGRIILLVSSDEETRRFIMMASEFGMTGGDYVFYTINVLPVDNISIDIDIWKGDDGRDEEARLAFECVFHVTLAVLASETVVKFREEVAKKMQSEDWKRHSLPGYSDDVISDVTMGDRFSPFLYDAIILYAQALKATINKGQNVSNGTQVAMNFKNQFFSGISGNVILDSNGDREPDYWILDLDPETGRFEKIAEVVNLRNGKREFHKDLRLPSWPGGKVGHHFAPPDTPPCGFAGEICQGIMAPWILAVIVVLIILFLAGSILVAVCLIRKSKFESGLLVQAWKLNYFDIEMVGSKKDKKPTESTSSNITGSVHSNVTDEEIMGSTSMGSVTKSSACLKSISSLGTFHQQIFSDIGYHRGVLVAVKHIKKEHIQISRSILLEFNQLKDIAHCNLNVFVGACIDPPNICLVWHYCPKGSLQDLVMNDEIKLEITFKLSFLMDICKGMQYLHKSHLHSHGNLKSSNCLVDARWNVRITDYGLPSFLSGQHFDLNEQDLNRRKLWMAPELLRENSPPACGTQKGDVYSFAIIAFEIILRSEPYPLDIMTAKDVVNRVRNGESIPFRPFIPESCDASQAIVDLIRSSWEENPDDRPNFVQIRSTLKKQAKGEINIMDNVLNMMERYAYNLEEIVEERTQQLLEEKKKTDRLLYRMLPSTVAEQLKLGRTVKPETYDQATLYFSDIVGFVTMASESSPLQIVEFLNDLYSYFDDIIGKHDVYKVETIGDSYVVVSGVPVRNGQRHTAEIANLSLDLLSSVLSYKIKHRPNQRVQLRIGLHTGPVVAGVVGLTMPRYCLFGDTVNMTSRMESSGKAFHIHMSKQCYIALSETGGYEMTLRGEMNVKGKGLQTTYWLHGKKGYDKPLPEIET